MGKYMKKSKITGDIAVMEVSPSTIGVRTRAKTLALQRLQKPSSSPNPDEADASFCYLQLRNRRLEKSPPPFKQQDKDKSCRGENPNSKPNSRLSLSSVNSGSLSCNKKELEGCFGKNETTEDFNELGIEVSFGENSLDFEPRDRSTRESTPCSFIRASDPGSTTRRTKLTPTNQEGQNEVQRITPTTKEMEELFACAEQQQRRLFIEKYNFDIVNDMPLPGRYEWLQVVP